LKIKAEQYNLDPEDPGAILFSLAQRSTGIIVEAPAESSEAEEQADEDLGFSFKEESEDEVF
jgi:hypothetical protein